MSKVWRDAEKSDASLPGGSLSALSSVGEELYNDGKCEHAIYWWRKAADRGDVDAMYEMAQLLPVLTTGLGVTLDHTKASEWWERASGCGHARRDLRLADATYTAYGVEKNEAKAIELYVKAAELGSELPRTISGTSTNRA